MASKGELFFERMKAQLFYFKNNIKIWENSDPQKVEHMRDIISQEKEELLKLQNYVDNTKVYVVIMGTMSSGKSTFINSLLGAQLLPSKNQECTMHLLQIQYGEELQIEGEILNNFKEGMEYINKLQEYKDIEAIGIKTPSVFHKSLPADLRERIIFIDTPGIKQNQQIQEIPFEMIQKITGNQHVINIWVANYTSFDDDKQRIYQTLNKYREYCQTEKNKQIISDNQTKQVQFQFSKNQEIKCQDKLIFILNKWDEYKPSEDDQIQTIIADICDQVSDTNFVYKISSLKALKYRVMTFGDPSAQEQFILKEFLDYKVLKGFKEVQDCKKYCSKFTGQQKLILNTDYQLLLEYLSSQLQMKIIEDFDGDLSKKLKSLDCILEMMIRGNSKKLMDQSGELKCQIGNLIKIIFDELLKKEHEQEEIREKSKKEIHSQIEKTKQNLKLMLTSGKGSSIMEITKNMCKELLMNEQIYKKEMRDLNNKYQDAILKIISSVNINLFSVFDSKSRNSRYRFSLQKFICVIQ